MSDEPELRAGPPWVMEEMILRQPELPAALLPGDGVAGAIAAEPGLCLGVSHDGGTRATRLALDAARAAGARTALVTARPGGEVARAADHVLVTPLRDASWCHTVAYTSALLAGAAIAGDGTDPGALAGLLAAAPDARPLAEALAGSATLAAAGAGVDAVTARELALKVAEGARIPARASSSRRSCTATSPAWTPAAASSSSRSPRGATPSASPAAPGGPLARPRPSACRSARSSPRRTTAGSTRR